MLFYTALFLTSLILTLVILWIYKLIVVVVRYAFRGNLRNEKPVSTGYLDQRGRGRISRRRPEAWGDYGHANPSTMARTHPAVPEKATPWGWPSHDQVNNEYHPVLASSREGNLNTYLSGQFVSPQVLGTGRFNVDRPDRDDHPAFIGRAYIEVRKGARKAASKDLSHKVDGKPWGW